MKKYRVVSRLAHNANETLYNVQVRLSFIWFDATEPSLMGYPHALKFYSLDNAIEKVNELVANDIRELERKSKHKAFKSKVVYGPYPP